ncbi:MAG: hypothetical protein ACE5FR_13145, partial [Rhodospirillales bacterium]
MFEGEFTVSADSVAGPPKRGAHVRSGYSRRGRGGEGRAADPENGRVLHAIDGPAGKIDPFDPQRRDRAKLAYSTHAVPDSG